MKLKSTHVSRVANIALVIGIGRRWLDIRARNRVRIRREGARTARETRAFFVSIILPLTFQISG
jgi:hypothetical protein